MALGLFPQLALNAVGAAGAAYLDRTYPGQAQHIGQSATSPGVEITLGAMVSAGVTLLLMLLPGGKGGAAMPMWKSILANLAAGGLVWEGGKLIDRHLVPMILPAPAAGVPGGGGVQLPPGGATVQGMGQAHGVHGLPYGAPRMVPPWQVQQALGTYRQRRAA